MIAFRPPVVGSNTTCLARIISLSLIALSLVACVSPNEILNTNSEVRLAEDSLTLSPEQMRAVRQAVDAVISRCEPAARPSDFLVSYNAHTISLLVAPQDMLGPARRYDAVVERSGVVVTSRDSNTQC